MEHKIFVVGIGPGNPDYVLPAAKKAIAQASVIVGGRRALKEFALPSQETCAITGDLLAVMEFIRSRLQEQDVVVIVSGDPGYYSMLDSLRREFPVNLLSVIPGISSVQYAFAKLSLPWHDAKLISMHGREPKPKQLDYEAGAMLGILTDAAYTSHTVPKKLMEHGWSEVAKLYICSKLSYAEEEIISTTLGEAEKLPEVKHCVLVVTE